MILWITRIVICLLLMSGMLGINPCRSAESAELIIFSQLTDGYWQLWQMAPDGSDAKQLTNSAYDKRASVCAEKAKKILYRTNNGQLKMLNMVTKEEQEILSNYYRISNLEFCESTGMLMFERFDPRELDSSDIWTASCSVPLTAC